jgi:hypothetical protein
VIAKAGVIVGLLTATAVLACAELRAALLAVIVIDFTLPLAGAVNNPAGEMLPALADQVTAVLLVFDTAAEN